MKLSIVSLLLSSTLVAATRETQNESGSSSILPFPSSSSSHHLQANTPDPDNPAIRTRELIAYRSKGLGVLMNTFKTEDNNGQDGLQGLPLGLQEYYANYPDGNGQDILLLAMPISKIYRNALPPHSPNLTLTISDLEGLGDGNLSAGRMRVALFGSLERVSDPEEVKKCKEAYLKAHPDSRGWIPGSETEPHFAFYARLRVEKVYAFGGFGDVAYIGWIPPPLYVSSGDKMRSKDQVLKDWPEPIQPEPVASWAERDLVAEELFAESKEGIEKEEGRFRIQW